MKKSRIDKHVSENQPFLFDEPEPVGDWDFNGQNTRYLTHELHPYLASIDSTYGELKNLLLCIFPNTVRVSDGEFDS